MSISRKLSSPPCGSRRLRWAPAATMLAAILLSNGCAGGGAGAGRSSGGHSSIRVAASDEQRYESLSTLGYRLEWSGFAVVPRGREVKRVRIWEDVIAVHETGNSMTLLEAPTGRSRWNTRLGGSLEKFVGFERMPSGQIINVGETELFVINDRTGVLEDRQRLAVLANTRPIRDGAILVVGGVSGEILGHNLKTGFKQWGYQRRAGIEVDPIRLDDSVAVVSNDGGIVILEPLSGGSLGESTMYDGAMSAPSEGNGLIFCASRDQSLWAFPAVGGEAHWRHRTQHRLEARPVFHDGFVFLSIPGEGLTAFESGSGELRWSNPEVEGDVVAVRDGNLIVWDGSTASSVAPRRGDLIAQQRIEGATILETDEFVDGNLYVVEPGGRIQKYSPR